MDYTHSKPSQVRELIRKGALEGPTTGMCNGYAQGNLVILPEELSWDFLLFCQRNPRACPLLEVSDAGSRSFPQTAKGSDITKDIPRYRIYENGVFSGTMVVSMRPIPHSKVSMAVAVTAAISKVHGAPIHIGYPEAIGIKNIKEPDYGDPVTIKEEEVPVFWPCGVTPQAVLMNSRPSFAMAHAPGHMFITDVKNTILKYS